MKKKWRIAFNSFSFAVLFIRTSFQFPLKEKFFFIFFQCFSSLRLGVQVTQASTRKNEKKKKKRAA